MKTKLLTSKRKIKELLSDKNFRNSQNYLINKEKGYKIVREYDANITKKIFVGFGAAFVGMLYTFVFTFFIVILISLLFFLKYINISQENSHMIYSNFMTYFHFIFFIFFVLSYLKINKIGEKRFKIFVNRPNRQKILHLTKDKSNFISSEYIGYILVNKN